MSEQLPNSISSNRKTIVFMIILSFFCALILSILASALAKPKEIAKDLDRIKQLMIAAKILDHDGYFLIKNKEGDYEPAKFTESGYLVPSETKEIATQNQLLEVYKNRVKPILVNDKGEISTFEKQKINESEYLGEYRKIGYYKAPWKLIYEILPNSKEHKQDEKAEGYVFPINGFGLWDAIYGYLAIEPDGDTVIGISWYDQKETPGLGANISEPYWQDLFPGKKIFQESANGTTDYKTASLGLTVVKGKVSEVYGDGPKSKSAIDGMTGATLTGNGVTDAYREVLAPYRPFLIKIHDENIKTKDKS